MNSRTVEILSIVGLVIALAIMASMLPSQSQAMPPDVEEQNQTTEEQVSPQDGATATITITMTTMPIQDEQGG